MPHKNYRYYCLDTAGQLHNSVVFHADDDEDAITQIKAKHPHDKCEIWQARRLVARLGPDGTAHGVRSSMRTLAEARRVLKQTESLVARRLPESSRGELR